MTRTSWGLSFAWLAALCVIATGAWAQTTDAVPLKNWAAPLYWQPSEGESALGKQNAEGRAAEVARVVSPPAVPLAQISSAPLVFVAVTPCRLVDTRTGSGFTGQFGPPSLTGGVSRTFPLQSSSTCSIPATAQAYSLNFTVVPPGPLGYITVWPTGQTQPLVSTLNDPTATIVANAAIVPAGTSGSIDVFASNNTDVIIDINGYYAAPSVLALGAGTAAAPSLTFSRDANSGLYSPAAGTVEVTASGTNILTVNSGGISVAGGIVSSGASFDGIVATSSAPNSAAIIGQALSGSTSSCGVCGYNDSTTGFGVLGSATTNGTGGRFLANSSGTALVAEQPAGTQVMKVDAAGVHAGPGLTGTPLAYGAFDGNGTRQSGSSNISCPWNATSSWYQCTITGENYFYLSYVANVTAFNFAIATTNSVSGDLLIIFYNTAGTPIQLSSGFQVAVYKP